MKTKDPIQEACDVGDLVGISELIKRIDMDANMIVKETQQWTILHYAIHRKSVDIASSLIAKGADINANTRFDQTPLHLAVSSGSPAIVQLLLDAGIADVNALNKAGDTPLILSTDAQITSMSCQTCQLFNSTINKTDPFDFLRLLAHGAKVNIKSGLWTPLTKAAMYNQKEIVRILLEHGADSRQRNYQGQCPQDCAISDEVSKLIREYSEKIWHMNDDDNGNDNVNMGRGVPTLVDLCCWHFKNQRASLDENAFVDTIPDAVVYGSFSDWDGADQWVQACEPQYIHDAMDIEEYL